MIKKRINEIRVLSALSYRLLRYKYSKRESRNVLSTVIDYQGGSTTMKKMTRSQIEKFAVGYPYPTDVVEIVLKSCDYNQDTAHEILLDEARTLEVFQNSPHVNFV